MKKYRARITKVGEYEGQPIYHARLVGQSIPLAYAAKEGDIDAEYISKGAKREVEEFGFAYANVYQHHILR